MDQGVPPPPGGYGLPPDQGVGNKAPDPEPAPRRPAHTSPFRTNYYAPPPPAPGRRWAVGGGIGAALLGVRMLLLCGRVASSGSDSDYSYTPSTYPTFDPNTLAALFDASSFGLPTRTPPAQPIAVASDGTAYWWSYGAIEAQAPGQTKVKEVVTDVDTELQPSLDSDIAVSDKSLFWVTSHAEGGDLVSVARSGGKPRVISKDLTNPGTLLVDGASILVTVQGDAADQRALVRIPAGGGAGVRLASWGDTSSLAGSIASDGSSVYVVASAIAEDYSSFQVIGRIPRSGGKMENIVTLPAGEHVDRVAAGGKNVYFTSSVGVLDDATTLWKVPTGGGARSKVYTDEASDAALGDLVVTGGNVLLAHRADGVWRISRPGTKEGLDATPLDREPHFAVTKDLLVWSTGSAVQSAPQH
jgi:hypothetical protein